MRDARTSIVLLAAAAVVAALFAPWYALDFGGAAGDAMVRGPGGDIVSLQWGPWLALAGAVAIVAASLATPRAARAPAPAAEDVPAGPPPDPRPVAATVWPPVET